MQGVSNDRDKPAPPRGAAKRAPTFGHDLGKPKTNPFGHPIVKPPDVPRDEFGEDLITGQYEGDELTIMRGKRPTHSALRHLEKKHDTLAALVLPLVGKVDGIHTMMARAEEAREAQEKREQARRDARGKWIIALIPVLAAAIAAIAVAVR